MQFNNFRIFMNMAVKLISVKNILVLLFLFFLQIGCAQFNKIFSSDEPKHSEATQTISKPLVKFSDNPQMGVFNERQYKRKTKKSLEESSDLGARAGSLFVMEGQGAFLFTQNTIRREGDQLKVKLEGAHRAQVESKIEVIKKLLARLAAPPPIPNPLVAGENNSLGSTQAQVNTAEVGGTDASKKLAAGPSVSGTRQPSSDAASLAAGAAVSGANAGSNKEAEEILKQPFNVENIPAKIVERMVDGSYRIKGSENFMIGKREYRVIVTGLIKPEDYNDEGVSASQLLDPQFDVVSLRRNL